VRLEFTRYGFILVLADAAGLSINLDSDIGITEAMPIDGKVLSTVGVTLMSADI